MADESLERWRRASDLFDRVRDLGPEARSAFLAEACGADAELIRLVEELVDAGEGSGSTAGSPLDHARPLLERLAISVGGPGGHPFGDSPTIPDTSLHVFDEIDPYRLLEKIGEGGMGEVWRAEQLRPMRRDVALKVIKAGLDTKRIVARFEAERQALAMMDHPAIARVYEAGETPRGLPYFVMEYVAGDPVTDYCDRHRLSTKERVDLLTQICAGVQHAHEKGVIHRDLKPSNVLVTVQGDRPVPKIIDFGVAKATAHRLTERTLFTELGTMIGTPSYMSPEQAATSVDVDTRTDVYALGVMLYELLTGVRPFDAKTLREAGYEEIRRRIREVDPPKPSTRAGKLGDSSVEIARRRGTVPAKLVSRLKGDLDWIVMKCLEKDRTRRYASPNELAADLQRHLANEPVAAGPPDAAYRARKFVRRHRIGVGIASASVIALAAFTVSTSAQSRRIAAERDRADREAEVSRRVTDFMTGLFEVSDPSGARGSTITAREILDRGAEKLATELDDEPEVKARLLLSLARVYRAIGLYSTADELGQESIEIYSRVLGPEAPRTLEAEDDLANTWDFERRFADAETLLTQVVEKSRRVLGGEHEQTLDAINTLAVILERQGRHEEAGPLYREVLDVRNRTLKPDDLERLHAVHNLGAHLTKLGRLEEAEPLLREAVEGHRRILGDDHPQTLWFIGDLAEVLLRLGRAAEAESLAREQFEGKRRVQGAEHLETRRAMFLYASTLEFRGRLKESEEICRSLAEMTRRLEGPEDRRTLSTLGLLATVLAEEGKWTEAERVFRQVMEGRRRTSGVEDPGALLTMLDFAASCIKGGRLDQAESLLDEAWGIALPTFGREHMVTGSCALTYSELAVHRGRTEEALSWLRKSAEARFGGFGAGWVAQDENLAPLRGNPEFERILADTPERRAAPVAQGVAVVDDR